MLLVLCGCMFIAGATMAQDDAATGDADTTEAVAPSLESTSDSSSRSSNNSGSFITVVTKSGAMGIILWLSLFGAAGAGVYFAVDCGITVRAQRIMPTELVNNVTNAMAEGDVLKALKNCEDEPGPLSNVLTA